VKSAGLAGWSHHTVARYVPSGSGAGRGGAPAGGVDEFLPKPEELVERSKGKIRADRRHEKIAAMSYGGSEHTTLGPLGHNPKIKGTEPESRPSYATFRVHAAATSGFR
jgi:hypothetical protein